MAAAFFMGIALAFLLYVLVTYVRWSGSAKSGASFAKDYWYTAKNPLHRTWWPVVAVLVYLILVAFFGMTA